MFVFSLFFPSILFNLYVFKIQFFYIFAILENIFLKLYNFFFFSFLFLTIKLLDWVFRISIFGKIKSNIH